MSKYCYKCEKDVELVKAPDSNAQLCAKCGTILLHSASKLPQGTVIGGFEIETEIGRGGMGIVYKAKQLNLERHVALKVLADDLSKDSEFVENFFKEARAAASLNHPNIVQVFDAGSTPEGIYYFAMELIVGETLESRIVREGSMDPKEALRIAVKMSDALEYAWQNQKLTHGDIKPENIILDSSGGAKLADLGLAKFIHDDKAKGSIMATPLYAPPEIIKAQVDKISCQSDMYSFGVTLFQMLAGATPFPDGDPEKVLKNHLETTPPPLSQYNPRLAPVIVQLVNQLLEKEPAERPFSWTDIGKALKKIRQPEVEGKIFHTHHTETSSTALKTSPPTEPESANKIKPLIGILVAIVAGLGIAIGALVYFESKSPKKVPAEARTSENLKKMEEAIEGFSVLKKQLEFFTPEQALAQVERFVAQHGANAPVEATHLLEKLKKQISDQETLKESRTAEFAAFRDSLAKVLESVRGLNLSDESVPTETIEKAGADIEGILALSSGKTYLTIPQDDRQELNKSYMQISEVLIRRRQKAEEEARRQAEEKRRHDEELEKQRKAEIEQRRLDAMQLNRAIDEYYIAMARYLRSSRINEFEDTLKAWCAAKTVPADYSIRAKFLVEKAIPGSKKFIDLMTRNIDAFKGQTIPPAVCPPKLKNYTVRDIDATGIRMILSDGKVSMGQTLNWNSMPPKITAALLKDKLLISPDGKSKLSQDDTLSVLSHILLFDHSSMEEVTTITLANDNPEKPLWEQLSKDFSISENEARLSIRFAQMKELIDKGDQAGASDILATLFTDSADTNFGARYADELARLKDLMASINPMIAASSLLGKLNSQEIRQNPVSLVSLCNAIESRYSKILSPQILSDLKTTRESTMTSIADASSANNVAANRVPFYYWETEKFGDSWAFCRAMQESGRLSSNQKVLKSLQLSSAVDCGDWSLAKSLLDSGESLDIQGLEQMTRTQAWAPSFIFANGLLHLQFSDPALRDQALSALFRLTKQPEHPLMTPVSSALAMEYALLCRQPVRVASLADEYSYKLGATARIESRVAFLGFLAAIEKPSTDIKEIERLFHRLNKAFSELPELRQHDIIWCRIALSILKGEDVSEQVGRLKNSKCIMPDVAARILLSSLARSYCSRERLPREVERTIISAISSRIVNLPVAAETWRRFAIFKATLRNSPSGFRASLADSLEDYRVCATSSYPFIISIKSASEFPATMFNRNDAKDNITRFLAASVVASPADVRAADTMTAENPIPVISRFYLDNLPDKALQAAVIAIMANYQQPPVRASVVKVINENYATLTWEERFMITRIQNWR